MSSLNAHSSLANREKGAVALSSVLAAVFLTFFKLIVGLVTNSLGILSEAAHSGLDLVAALLTFLAVRLAGRPADRDHPFGHGKIENLSALVETFLLLLTCVWIIYEAIQRLFFRTVEVEATVWSFVVMGLAIVVDVSRSRALYRVARKYNSQALEADALHFSTDVWSSSVVIGGLILVRLADVFPQYRDWLLRADAVAALVVAGIVIWVSLQLGRRTLDALLDRAPEGLEERVRAAIQSVPHVQGCGPVRLRTAGPVTFVEATVRVAPDIPAGMAHEVATRVEEAVATLCSDCDVTVHVEPAAPDDVAGQVRAVAANAGLHVHDVHIHHLEDGYHIHLDLEISGERTLEEAHQEASAFEKALRERVPGLAAVETHIEVTPVVSEGQGEDVTDSYQDLLSRVREIAEGREGVIECHDLRLRRVGDALYLSLHCVCPANMPMEEAHRCAAQVEGLIRREFPFLAHVLVHTEPG
ncbi:MAG: cation diffusion facilitator family transporter [Anaerolineae bacterium]|nr:cation-efflux pump [Anaerolineae bacterium]MDW7991516.1 cation diffusion facilitator family transporter [Anaerolineae bacterium]